MLSTVKTSIKPTHTIFCPGCNHSKLSFSTLKEASRFIKYNSKEIFELTGKSPCRAYWCKYCGAWHVTSRSIEANKGNVTEEGRNLHHKNRRVHDHKQKDAFAATMSEYKDGIKIYYDLIDMAFRSGNLSYCSALIEESRECVEFLRDNHCKTKSARCCIDKIARIEHILSCMQRKGIVA